MKDTFLCIAYIICVLFFGAQSIAMIMAGTFTTKLFTDVILLIMFLFLSYIYVKKVFFNKK